LLGDKTEKERVGKDGCHTQDGEASEPSVERGAIDRIWTPATRDLDEVLFDLHHVTRKGEGWGDGKHDSEHSEVAKLAGVVMQRESEEGT
jgi:hypothetical protein